MGRALRRLLLALPVAFGLVGCGDAPSEPDLAALLVVPGDAEDAKARVPGLVGYAAPVRWPAGQHPGFPPPRAGLTDDGQLSVPREASWGSVVEALDDAALLAIQRGGFDPDVPAVVDVPGGRGQVRVGPPSAREKQTDRVGLDLDIRQGPARTQVFAVGVAWVAVLGCDARRSWTDESVSLATWREALEALAGTGEATSHALRLRADAELPASAVIPFIEAATAAGFEPLRVRDVRPQGSDALDDGLFWLPAHQAPTGAWDDRISSGYCGGRTMRDDPPSVDPERVANAGQTGLCLLTILTAGYSPRGDHPFAATVQRGLRHLKDLQAPDGTFAAADGWSPAITQGLGALAMVTAYGMTASPIFKGSAQRALDALGPAWERAGDEPLTTALAALTLRTALKINKTPLAGARPPPLPLEGDLVERVRREGRSYALGTGDLRAACGLVVRLALDPEAITEEEREAALAGQTTMLVEAGAGCDPCQIWMASLAGYQVGGKPWDHMKHEVLAPLVETLRRDGHACCAKGSWDPPERMVLPGGRTTTTALVQLSMHEFYRFDRVWGMR